MTDQHGLKDHHRLDAGDALPAWRQAARAFVSSVEPGRLDVPLPGSGSTRERWAAFADLAEEDLSLARLGEGHAVAVALLAELDGPPGGYTDRPGFSHGGAGVAACWHGGARGVARAPLGAMGIALRSLRVRALTEAAATDVLASTGRARGAGSLGHDEAHSRAVADLTVYLRQHHAERDLARVGELVVATRGADW
jgi:hypothetical protein